VQTQKEKEESQPMHENKNNSASESKKELQNENATPFDEGKNASKPSVASEEKTPSAIRDLLKTVQFTSAAGNRRDSLVSQDKTDKDAN